MKIKRNGKVLDPEHVYLFQSTYYFEEIVKIKRKFEKEQIDFVFIKGLPIHLYIENNHPRRMYFDCDVLVLGQDFERAEKTLIAAGYKRAKDTLSGVHTSLKNKKIEMTYYKTINNINVVFDLHVEVVFMMTQLGKLNALYSQRSIDELTHSFLQEKRSVRIGQEVFPILSVNDLIIYLALHLFHHNFKGYYRYDFLDKAIRKENIDWDKIIEKVQMNNLRNFVYPVFLLLQTYYKSPIPKKLLAELKPSRFVLRSISRLRKKFSIFDDEKRVEAGVDRFRNLFTFSQNNLLRKLLVFSDISVVYSIFWVFQRRILQSEH